MQETLKILITAEVSKFKKGLQDAKNEVKNFKTTYQEAKKDCKENFEKIGSAISSSMKKAGTAILGAGTALVALGASTKDYREAQAKLTTAFQTAGGSAEVAKKTYNELYRVMGEDDTAVEAANHLAKMTTNQKELSQWTNICQGIYATFGDSLPIEGLTESANETAKVGTVTGSLADALNWAGVSEDDFNEKLAKCTSESQREKLIRETLNGLYDDAAKSYEKNNKEVIKQNEAQAKLQETTAALGEAVAPVVTAFTSFASDALAVVVPYIQDLAEKYMPELEKVLDTVTTSLENAFNWASKHKTLLATIGAVIGIVTTAIGAYLAVSAIQDLMQKKQCTTVAALTAHYIAHAAAMFTTIAPYVAVVAAIAAVIAIIVLCVKHWDEIKETVRKVWQKIENLTKDAVKVVVQKFEELKSKAIEKVNSLKEKAVEKFESIKNGIKDKVDATKTAVKEKFEELKTGAIEKIDGLKTGAVQKFESIKSSIKEKINGAKDAVKEAIDKMKNFFNFKWSLPKLKLPKISISGKFSLNPVSVPKFSISWHKLGGVFDSPTLFNYGGALHGLGEDGAEAVVPLEKNTKWLDRLATMLSSKQGNRPIILEVDGKTFAQTSIDSINQLTKQTGKIGLRIV